MVLLTGCVPTGMARPPELPADTTQLSIVGVSFAAPGGPGWFVKTRERYSLEIVKWGQSKDETIVLNAYIFHAPAPVPGKDFVEQVKEAEAADTDPKRFTMRVHEVTPVTVGSTVCARSHMVAEDAAPENSTHQPMFLEILSLNCPHPDDPRAAFNVGYSQRAYPGHQDPDFMQKATTILDSVQITKLQ
jgi:hypothetical protein